jgi:hypothetical protein
VDALSGESVEVGGKGRDEGLSFTCFHFGDTSLMEHDSADDLNREVLHAEHAPARLAAGGKGVWKDIVERFAVRRYESLGTRKRR